MKGKTRILLCDDHTLFREGIKAILKDQPAVEIVAEAENGREAVAQANRLHPDVILMDIAMPDLGGFEATGKILRSNPRVKVLILTMYEEDEVVSRCLKAGAAGYVLKDAPRSDLLHAIDVVNRGGQYLSSRVLKKVVKRHLGREKAAVSDYDRLSDREREVLKLLADGLTLKDIATRLLLSVKTVDAHKTNLMRKLDLHSRSDLIKYAIRRKLIRLPPNSSKQDAAS